MSGRWCGNCRTCGGKWVVPDCETTSTLAHVVCPSCGGLGCKLARLPGHTHAYAWVRP